MCPLSIRLVIYYGIWSCCIAHVDAGMKWFTRVSSSSSPAPSTTNRPLELVQVHYDNDGLVGLVGLGTVKTGDGRFSFMCSGVLVQIGNNPTSDVIVTHAECIKQMERNVEFAYGRLAAIAAKHDIFYIKHLVEHKDYFLDYSGMNGPPSRQDDIGIAILEQPIPVGIFELSAHEEEQPKVLPYGKVAWISDDTGIYHAEISTADFSSN